MRNAAASFEKQFPTTQRGRNYQRRKRVLDIAFALVGGLSLLPLICLTALAVALDVGWPLIFRQVRAGRGGRPIVVYKFRTMRCEYDASGRALTDAQRTSATGRFLRRSRLDELPQLLNILKGDMSLVGPRPLVANEQDQALQMRLAVRPGLTGWAQINGGRGLSIKEKALLDTWYVRNASLSLDTRILLRTVSLLLRGGIDRVPHRSAVDASFDGNFSHHSP
jgi:lipopolysaccharide/colanic/teichoic acid biosynthesis glycosyltransferase